MMSSCYLTFFFVTQDDVTKLECSSLWKVLTAESNVLCGLYYKHITILIDTASVVSK